MSGARNVGSIPGPTLSIIKQFSLLKVYYSKGCRCEATAFFTGTGNNKNAALPSQAKRRKLQYKIQIQLNEILFSRTNFIK